MFNDIRHVKAEGNLIRKRFTLMPQTPRLSHFYLYSVVLSSGYNPTAIWGKSYGIHPSSVALVCMDASFLSDIPYLKISIKRARCKELPKRVEVHRYAIGSVTSKCANNYIKKNAIKKR